MSVDDEGFTLRPDWSAQPLLPVQPVNVFITQMGSPAGSKMAPEGIFVSFGMTTPPVLLGSEEENMAELARLQVSGLRVDVAGKFLISRGNCEELVGVLQRALEQHDEFEAAVAAQT